MGTEPATTADSRPEQLTADRRSFNGFDSPITFDQAEIVDGPQRQTWEKRGFA